MSSTKYAPGTRVRAVVEGTVVDNTRDLFYVGRGGPHLQEKKVISIEVVEPPKPAWQDGDVARVKYWDDVWHTNVRRNGRWTDGRQDGTQGGDTWIEAWISSDAARVDVLVRGGEPVSD